MRLTIDHSPNYNVRKHAIDMLVLHYTGMVSAEAAIDRLKDPAAEVSAHYVVREDGVVIQMVAETHRAWHAGRATWQGDGDLNSRSIGIEIVNGGHDIPQPDGGLPPYPDVQIAAVISLCRAIMTRHTIRPSRIVGHSDIAPDRKRDPGEHFPWKRLSEAGIGVWPELQPSGGGQSLIGRGLGRSDTGPPVTRLREQLSTIGYGLDGSTDYDAALEGVVMAFQRRWLPERLTGQADLDTIMRIDAIAKAYSAGAL